MLLSQGLKGELLRLDVIGSGDLQPLTLTNARHVARLAGLLAADHVLRNPLLVTDLADRCVVLDGNARLQAARQIGLPDILVQHIPMGSVPEPLRLPAWAVTGVGHEDILRVIEPGFTRVAEDTAASLQLFTPDGARRSLSTDPDSPTDLWRAYRRMVTALQSIADLVAIPEWLMSSETAWPDNVSAVMVPPPLSHADVEMLAREQVRLPWGALQTPLPRRILGINLSLDVLSAPEPAAEKAAFVRELVRLRLSERRVHYYDAPVFIVED